MYELYEPVKGKVIVGGVGAGVGDFVTCGCFVAVVGEAVGLIVGRLTWHQEEKKILPSAVARHLDEPAVVNTSVVGRPVQSSATKACTLVVKVEARVFPGIHEFILTEAKLALLLLAYMDKPSV